MPLHGNYSKEDDCVKISLMGKKNIVRIVRPLQKCNSNNQQKIMVTFISNAGFTIFKTLLPEMLGIRCTSG